MKNMKLIVLIEVAIMAALAVVVDLIPSIKLTPSISFNVAMVPIFLLAFRRGFKAATLAGFIWGLLQVALGEAWVVHPIQVFLEYFVAFAFIGGAGLFSSRIQSAVRDGRKKGLLSWMLLAILVGSVARYFWHFIAGVFFFGYLAPDNLSPVLFSFAANGASMLGSAILCAIVLCALVATAPRLVKVEDGRSVNHKAA
ncbi:energy-coupled thiamine transporter ThiT [Bacillus sp. JRC01]|nr:energy-coupled thiamine transporter ThiT [Bacillus sp. JRC01]